MATNNSNFPTSVWDRTSPSRPSINIERSPDAEDWEQMAAEIVAIQNTLVGNNSPAAVGAIPVIFKFVIGNAAGDTDIILTHKTRVIDAWAVKTTAAGGAGDTVTVKNGATAITNAIVVNVADQTVVRAGTIDDAQHVVNAGGTLRVTAADVTDPSCIVYVKGIREL